MEIALVNGRQLGRGDHHLAVFRRGPHEAAFLQPLGEQTEALAVPPQHLQQIAATATEHEQMAAERVLRHSLLHHSSEPVEALAHVGTADRQPYPRPEGSPIIAAPAP